MPYKWRQICRNSLVIVSTLDNIGRSPRWEGLDPNLYSHMSYLNVFSPLWEGFNSNLWPWKSRQGHKDGKSRILQKSFFFTFLICAEVRPVPMIVTHTQHTESDKPMAIGEILHICINILNVWPSQSRSKSRNLIFAITPFDGKGQNI